MARRERKKNIFIKGPLFKKKRLRKKGNPYNGVKNTKGGEKLRRFRDVHGVCRWGKRGTGRRALGREKKQGTAPIRSAASRMGSRKRDRKKGRGRAGHSEVRRGKTGGAYPHRKNVGSAGHIF